MLSTLIFVALASLHTPAPAFANYVFTVPVRIENMTHITTATASCTLTSIQPTTPVTSLGSASTSIPISGGSFTGNVIVTLVVSADRIAAYPPTNWSCGLTYHWRNPDGTTNTGSFLTGAREPAYTRSTGQEITTATVEVTGTLPPP